VLDPNQLVDSLVTDVIDGLRGDLHPQFGVRAYRVFTVRRTWSGRVAGEGTLTEVKTELLPQPMIEEWDGLAYRLLTCGLNSQGAMRLREVSLTYTHAEIAGPADLAENEGWILSVEEAYGQAQPARLFVIAQPPYVDRIKDMGWVVYLRAATEGG
jgi:hypothetical protein